MSIRRIWWEDGVLHEQDIAPEDFYAEPRECHCTGACKVPPYVCPTFASPRPERLTDAEYEALWGRKITPERPRGD